MKSSRNSELDDWTKLSVKFLSLSPKIPVETINLMNSRIPSFFNSMTASVAKSKSCPISSMDDWGSVPNPKYILITFSWLASSSFSMIRIASSFVDISNCKTSGNNVNQKKTFLEPDVGSYFWNSVYFQFLLEKCCITSTLPLMDSKSYSSNLSTFVQPPYSGSPFNLVSGEDFSSPSRVMDKVQRVDHADQNVAWNHYILSSRMISLLGHFMRKNELCHGFFLRWTNFYFSKPRNDRFWTEPLFAHGIPFGFKLKKIT